MTQEKGQLEKAVYHILTHYFHPEPRQEVVLVYDADKALLARALRLGLAVKGHPVSDLRVPSRAKSIGRDLWNIYTNADVALMMLASRRMWREFDLRKRLVLRDGAISLRCHCSSVFFDAAIPFRNMLRLYSADPVETQAFLTEIQARLPEQSALRIVAPGGTDLRLTAGQWEVSKWELATRPVGATVEGKIVADAGVFFAYADSPIELCIEGGRVLDIWCADCDNVVYKKYLACMEEARARDVANWQLTKVGIGGNPRARITDVAMETISVQKTVHFCFGDNPRLNCGDRNTTDWHGGAVIVNYPEYKVGDE